MKIPNFVKKIEEIKSKDSLDIGAVEDLSIGLMNLVSLEEHAYFSYIKTKDEKFLNVLETVRELRKKLLALMVKKDDGETWCMSKHLLASSMRLYEVGNRMLHEGKKEGAISMYEDAAELYGLFFKLNSEMKGPGKIPVSSGENEKKSIFGSIKELLECCKE